MGEFIKLPITPTKVQVDQFSSSGTWTKPGWARIVQVIACGGGGGGGSGRKNATATARNGGGGGSGGGSGNPVLQAVLLTDTVTITIGSGGAGAAAITANSTVGSAGATGGDTSFGAYLIFKGGPGVTGGIGVAVAQPCAVGSLPSTFPTVAVTPSQVSGHLSQPGGTGGSIAPSEGNAAGGTGGTSLSANGGAGGAINASGSVGANTGTIVGENIFGGGGGGGGSSTTVDAGSGANGGNYGGGGGGGGGSTNSVGNSGAGGNGSNGYMIVISYA